MPVYRVYVTCGTWDDYLTVHTDSKVQAIEVAEELLDYGPSWGCKVRCEKIMTEKQWEQSTRKAIREMLAAEKENKDLLN